ncbi:MAG: 50S ribosomal protein L10 [Actinomycetota bacterium]
MPRPEKVAAVKEISERFSTSEAALLTEFRGLSVSEIAEVRTALRKADPDTEYKVSKNTLARIAAKEVGLDDLIELLEGPTAIAYIKGDAAAAAKALDEAAKRFPVLTIKGGILSGKPISAEQAQALAKLEPRDTQLAKIAMMMNQPATLTVNVLAALLRDLGSMLGQVAAKKESGEPQAGDATAEESVAPEATEELQEESTDDDGNESQEEE